MTILDLPPTDSADDRATLLAGAHEHNRRCFWDFHECRWVCVAATEREPAAS